jgi:hypothetical protein
VEVGLNSDRRPGRADLRARLRSSSWYLSAFADALRSESANLKICCSPGSEERLEDQWETHLGVIARSGETKDLVDGDDGISRRDRPRLVVCEIVVQ